MTFTLASIVEGHGEVQALPILLRRLNPLLHVPRPVRLQRSRILIDDELTRYLQIARANILERGGQGAILIVFDADDDCPVALAADRLACATKAVDLPCACVVVNREFEAWLVAGDPEHEYEGDPESPRDPKRVLTQWYGRYRPSPDQPRLVARMDLGSARRCRSFRHLEQVLRSLSPEAI